MSLYHSAGLYGFLGSVVLFYVVSRVWGGRPRTVKQFFHDRTLRLNIFSLVAANLALGTGAVYVLQGTRAFGALYLLLPIMLLLGQLFYARFILKWAPEGLFKHGTLLAGLAEALDNHAGRRIYFQQKTTSYIILTYFFSLCYEIFVSANLLQKAIFPAAGLLGEISITFLLMAFVLTYVITGGYRTVQRTDFMQVWLGFIFMFILAYLLLKAPSLPAATKSPWTPTRARDWLGFATLMLTPFTAQIYGILNHSMASHQEKRADQQNLFYWACFPIFCVYYVSASVALHYNHSKGDAYAALTGWLSGTVHVAGWLSSSWALALAAVAMGAMIMSTVDTLTITVAQNAFEGIFGGDSKSDNQDAMELKRIRIAMLLIFPAAFLTLAWLWWTRPPALNLLFAVASPCEALAPLVVCMTYLASRDKIGAILRPVVWKIRYIDLYFYFLLPATLVVAFVLISRHSEWTRAVGFFAFAISAGLSILAAFGPGADKS